MGLIGAAAVIVNAEGAVLLVKHTYGKCNWEIPGGRAEEGESPVDTAIREVREETGLCVVAHHMTGYYYDQDAGGLHFVFCCEVEKAGTQATPDGVEISECGYWRPETLPRPISDFTLRAFKMLWQERHIRSQRLLGHANGWNEHVMCLLRVSSLHSIWKDKTPFSSVSRVLN